MNDSEIFTCHGGPMDGMTVSGESLNQRHVGGVNTLMNESADGLRVCYYVVSLGYVLQHDISYHESQV